MFKKLLGIVVIMFGLSGMEAVAGDEVEAINKVLQNLIPGSTPDRIAESVIPGLYVVSYGPDVLYITKDGRYVLEGDLLNTGTRENLTEKMRSTARLKLLNAVDPPLQAFSMLITGIPKIPADVRTCCPIVPFNSVNC